MRLHCLVPSLLAVAGFAVDSPVWPSSTYRHVLVLTIDGFQQADLTDPNLATDMPTIKALQAAGVTFTNATSPVPADSFPGLLGIVTGANPKTTGVYYDDTYSRALYPKDTTLSGGVPNKPLGTEVAWTEAVSQNSGCLNGIATIASHTAPLGAGYDATALDAAKLPKKLVGGVLLPYYPHEFLKVNTVFEVVHAAGLRTAWSDKHPSYEILNGPSGTGLDDFFGPESEAKIQATVPTDRINGTFALGDGGSNKASKSQGGSIGQDDLRVQAVLNQLQGKTSKGAAITGNPVPAFFGMNFIAVNSAQKFNTGVNYQPDNSLTTGAQLNGGIAADGTVSLNLHEAFAHTDASIGKIIAAMKATIEANGRSVYDNTLIVVTAKHGNTPRTDKAIVMPGDWFSAVDVAPGANYSAVMTYPGGVAPVPAANVARGLIDAVTMLWLVDQTQVATTVTNLQAFAAANPTLIESVVSGAGIPALNAGLGNPATDDRAPDIIVNLKPGVIVATSLKRAEHGGFTPEETKVPLILAGGLPSASRGMTQTTPVFTTQIAPAAVRALGLEPSALKGAMAESTAVLPGAINNPPVAHDDTLLAAQDKRTVVPSSVLTANDTDPDGDPLAVTSVSAASTHGGTVSLADGKIIYTPPAGFTGSDSFTYTVRDGVRVSQPIPTDTPIATLPSGITLPHAGYGSSAAAVPGHANEYFLMTDRGPNTDVSPGVTIHDPLNPANPDSMSLIVPKPDFAPEIAHVRWNADGSVTRLDTIVLKDASGHPLTGLPGHVYDPAIADPASGTYDPTNPASQPTDNAYTTAGVPIAVDPNGLDSEGLAAMADGTFWVSDEYGPYLVHFDAAGKTLERISPFTVNSAGHKLPLVLARRLANKGMEGLTVTPDETMLVGCMQSALVNDPVNAAVNYHDLSSIGSTKKCPLLRLITYRLVAGGGEAVGTVHQYAYLLEDQGSGSTARLASSEITALSNTDFLVNERDGNFAETSVTVKKRYWRISLTGATAIDGTGDTAYGLTDNGNAPLPNATNTGKTLETLLYSKTMAQAIGILAGLGITPVSKAAASTIDLNTIGLAYTHDKIEGVLSANGHLVISNDDDFGLNGGVAKIIPGTYPVGTIDLSVPAGQTRDYSQLLEVDPNKLATATGTVNVTVNAAGNTPPTISTVANQTVVKNTSSSALPVTVADTETAAANLVVSAVSNNNALVNSAGIVVAGTGANRTITITPLTDQIGTTTITLTVADAQGATATSSFTVTVTATNSAPTISTVPAQSVTADTATAALPVTVGDVETPAANLLLTGGSSNLTLVPLANIVLGGSGAARTVTVTPAAGQSGTTTITLTVTDAQGLTAASQFTMTVAAGAVSTPPSDNSSGCGHGSGLVALILGMMSFIGLARRRLR